jgi:hypothetical protein
MEYNNLDDLPYDVKDAYFRGLSTDGDPEVLEDLGIPTTPKKALDDYRRGRAALEASYRVSDAARTAPGGQEHEDLGPVPPDLIR